MLILLQPLEDSLITLASSLRLFAEPSEELLVSLDVLLGYLIVQVQECQVMSYISECKLQHTDYSLMTFLLKLQLGLFDCREMCALNRSSRGRVVGLAELSIQFNNNRPLLFKLDGVSCFASLKLARQIIGADRVLLFF